LKHPTLVDRRDGKLHKESAERWSEFLNSVRFTKLLELAKSQALSWSFKASLNNNYLLSPLNYGSKEWEYTNTCAIDTFLFLMVLIGRTRIIPLAVLYNEKAPFPEVIKVLIEQSQSHESVVYARKEWTWNTITAKGKGVDVCPGEGYNLPFEKRFNASRRVVKVDSGFGDQFQKLQCARIYRQFEFSSCSVCGKDCPNDEYYERMGKSRYKSQLRSVSVTEKDLLDPEAAFQTPIHTTTFKCCKNEKKNNVVLFEDENAIVKTRSCTGERTKRDIYRLQFHQRMVFFEIESFNYLPTPSIRSISSLKPFITLQDKRFLLIGIIFAQGYQESK
jgi:hypothetical protein